MSSDCMDVKEVINKLKNVIFKQKKLLENSEIMFLLVASSQWVKRYH